VLFRLIVSSSGTTFALIQGSWLKTLLFQGIPAVNLGWLVLLIHRPNEPFVVFVRFKVVPLLDTIRRNNETSCFAISTSPYFSNPLGTKPADYQQHG
jgi:hypothetical protein